MVKKKDLKRPAVHSQNVADMFKKKTNTVQIESSQPNESANTPNVNISPSSPSPTSPEIASSSSTVSSNVPLCPTPPGSVKLPKNNTLEKWKKTHNWLVITENKTICCKVCVSQKEKIILKLPSLNMGFINGSTNFKLSALKEHAESAGHKTGLAEAMHEEAILQGKSLPIKHVVQEVPENCAIASGLQKMGEKERSGLKKLFDIAHFIALKGRPFTDFKDHIELEKLHEVKFDTGAYENETACREFINGIASYLFEEDIRQKLDRVNFIAILIDGTTDRAVKEQEVLYVMYVDPDTHKPQLSFFEVLEMDEFDQTAVGVMASIKASFKRNKMSSVLDKVIYLSADGASVNSGKDSGLIAQFQMEHEWVLFVWCFSHRLELALKDSLQDFTAPVDETLMHLYYLYHKSSKKLRELKCLFNEFKDDFETYGDGIKPVKCTGTRWIDHRIRAMGRLVDKFGLYTRHLKEFIEENTNSTVKATVRGKLNKLIDAQVLLRSAFLKDVLSPAKIFSLVTQKENPNVMETVESVERTRRDYRKLLRKFERDQNEVLQLPSLKAVITEIESSNDDDDGQPKYQGQRLNYYSRAKQYIVDHCVYLIKSIIKCYDERYWFDDDETATNGNGTTNDHLVSHICKILNYAVWPTLLKNTDDDEGKLRVQLKSVEAVFKHFSNMDVLKTIDMEDVTDGYIEVVRYCQKYFDVQHVDQVELWHKILLVGKDKDDWRGVTLVIEICLCTPCSNATLERFFNQLKVVKTDQRTRLSATSLNSCLRVKLKKLSQSVFHDEYGDNVVCHWYGKKGHRRINQRKRKKYNNRVTSKKSREQFVVDDFVDEISSSSDDEISDDEL